MPAQSLDSRPPREGAGTKVQLVCLGSNQPEPLASTNAKTSYDASDDAEQAQNLLSHNESMTIMDLVHAFESVADKLISGPFTVDMYVGNTDMRFGGRQSTDKYVVNSSELRARGLLAQADISELKYQRQQGSAECIEKAVECREQALWLTPEWDEENSYQLAKLGASYVWKFQRLGDIVNIDKAIELLKQAIHLIPETHINKLGMQNNIGCAYRSRFERSGELSDLENAIDCLTQVVQLTPDGHPEKPSGHINLGICYVRRFKRFGEISDLENAIHWLTQGVQLTLNDHPDKPSGLGCLGISYQGRFERLGELSDLGNAIECQAQAVQLTPDGHIDKPGELSNLGSSYMLRFERLGELSDLEDAIECHTQAVQLTPNSHPDKPRVLNCLGTSHQGRFKRLDKLSDLENAIECHSQAVQLTPDGHPDKPRLLNYLGTSYKSRFERLGELSDLENAIDCLTQVVRLTPDDHPEKPSGHLNLGGAYMRRFGRLGELSDLENGVQCHTQAVGLSPDDHPDTPSRLLGLGSTYVSRFQRLGELSDLESGIEYQTQGVRFTPDGHPDKPSGLNRLGTSLRLRFEHLGEVPDLENAIECLTQAVQLTPNGHTNIPGWLNDLGGSYFCRFERLREPLDMENAIRCLTQAVQLTPDGHPNKPGFLNNLGSFYLRRSERFGMHADLERAQSIFQQGAQLVLISPESQIWCARHWAYVSSKLDLSPQQAFERCMELVPHLIWLGTTINQRYYLLSNVRSLALEAASWAISDHSLDLALEWLEQGRSIVWNQFLQLRTPFDDLSTVDQSLALHLKSVASQLEALGSRQTTTSTWTEQSHDLEKDAQCHRQLAAEWERGLNQARSLAGFENFLRPRKASELKRAAKDGPVVVINAHSSRWDALLIFPGCDDIAHIPLIVLSSVEAGESPVQLDFDSLPGHRGEWDRGFKRVNNEPKPEDPLKVTLVSLWRVVVKPVLDALACTRKLPITELPRVTWCATGPLARVPLHATGPYDGSSPNTFDLVISSYTPSLSALVASSAPELQSNSGGLAVGQKNTKGLRPLLWTEHELAVIKQHAQEGQFLQLDGRNATVNAVLNAMDEHSWVHLACHATQDLDNPAHSAFHLHDGKLTLEAITKRQFRNKGLAFLSACETAQGDGTLPDEAVHLAAGMLMAGYPSVIATMWSMSDVDGPEVAGRVYEELLRDGNLDHRDAGRALHKAVAELRGKIGVDSFMRWVPFIHIGV